MMTTDSIESAEVESPAAEQFRYIVRRLSAIRVERGDALVFKTDRELPLDVAERMAKAIGKAFPGTTVLILEAGTEFHIVRGYGKDEK